MRHHARGGVPGRACHDIYVHNHRQENRMRYPTLSPSALGVALFAAGLAGAQAAEAPYYNPANTASGSGKTTAYELYKTIGCPGRGILEAPCKEPAAPAAPAAVPAKPADGDNDGVVDSLDKCPTTPPGRKVNAQGCELDGDGDGVVDALDKCPTTPAGRKVNAQGCEMDGDNDGVVDALDKCPTTPPGRKVNAQGCDLDSDGDGVIDMLDQCPGTPAGDRVDAKGCSLPKVLVLKGVNFDNDKATLQASSNVVLDEAVATLKRYPGLKVEVAGHTDNVGKDARNLDLSERRAKTVMEYFVAHGIAAARLGAKGYGESQPIADNAKPAGRAQNRRVELRALD
jgi:OOP family OmpA-OmpF porin